MLSKNLFYFLLSGINIFLHKISSILLLVLFNCDNPNYKKKKYDLPKQTKYCNNNNKTRNHQF